MWRWVGLGLIFSFGCLLNLLPNGLLSVTHEGTLECVVPIDLIECAQLVCAQQGIASWCIWSWGILSWMVSCDIVGRVWLLTASLRLVVALVLGLIISSFPLLVVGGRLVGIVLLCEHLSQRSRWSWGKGLNRLHWWCIVYLWGWRCHKCGHLSHILLCWPSHGLVLLRWQRLCVGSC